MKVSRYVALLLVAVMAIGCGTEEQIQLPITTSSEQALEMFLKGREMMDRFRLAETREFMEKAVALDSNFALAYTYLAQTQSSGQVFQLCVSRIRDLLKDVTPGERIYLEAFLAGVDGDTDLRRRKLEETASMFPEDPRPLVELGHFYYGRQEMDIAIEYYNKAVDLQPSFSAPYNMLGYAYRQEEDYKLARKAFEKYTELIPDDPNPYDSYAELLMKMGKYEVAIENFQKAISIDSTFVFSYIGLAQNLVMKGRHEKARAELNKLWDIVDNDLDRRRTSFGIALSYIDEGDWESGINEMHRQISIAEKTNDTTNMAVDYGLTAGVLLESGQPNKALEYYTLSHDLTIAAAASEGVRTNAERAFVLRRALVAIAKGELDNGKALADDYKERIAETTHPNFQLAYQQLLGRIAMAEERWDDAIIHLEQSDQQNPYNLFRLAQVWEEKGNMERARELYKEAAHFNISNSLAYSVIRQRALKKLEALT